MRRSARLATLVLTLLIATWTGAARQPRSAMPSTVDVTVQEGTSMSVAISPDGRTLAIDLQGGIWTVPASGGAATRVTGISEYPSFDLGRERCIELDEAGRGQILASHIADQDGSHLVRKPRG